MTIINLAGRTEDYDVWTYPLDTLVLLTPGKPDQCTTHVLRFMVSGDKFFITGRGWAYTFRRNPVEDLWDPRILVGEWVIIDGGICQVTGIEMHRLMISPTNPYGDLPIGVLTRDRTELPEGYLDVRADFLYITGEPR